MPKWKSRQFHSFWLSEQFDWFPWTECSIFSQRFYWLFSTHLDLRSNKRIDEHQLWTFHGNYQRRQRLQTYFSTAIYETRDEKKRKKNTFSIYLLNWIFGTKTHRHFIDENQITSWIILQICVFHHLSIVARRKSASIWSKHFFCSKISLNRISRLFNSTSRRNASHCSVWGKKTACCSISCIFLRRSDEFSMYLSSKRKMKKLSITVENIVNTNTLSK